MSQAHAPYLLPFFEESENTPKNKISTSNSFGERCGCPKTAVTDWTWPPSQPQKRQQALSLPSVRTASPVRIQQEEVPKGGDSLEMWEISLSQQPPAPSEHGGTGQPIHSSPTCHHSSSKAFGAADHQRPPELLPPRGPQGSLA